MLFNLLIINSYLSRKGYQDLSLDSFNASFFNVIQEKIEENGDREKICRLYAAIGYSRYENDKAIDDLENVHEKLLGLQNGITDVDTYILWDKILDALIEQETNADKKGIYQSQQDVNNQAKVALEGEKE